MRRVVTALILVTVALSLAACASTPPATTPTTGTGTPAAGIPVAPAAPAVAAKTGDTLSPTQTVTPGEMFPTDPTLVPASIITDLQAKKPLMVLWFDPSTKVSTDQRKEVDATMKKYRGSITLVALDYTVGVSPSNGATLAPETQKLELLAGALKLDTTPYILFVDRFGRITYRYAGFTDRKLLNREVLRATE